MKKLGIIAAISFAATSALADSHASSRGDVVAGEQQFNRQCGACHVVRDDTGRILAGRNTKPGPNLFGVAGRQAGSMDGMRYGDSLQALGETGAIWTEDAFVAYVQDPTNWLRNILKDRRARSKMAYRVRQENEAFDLYAYLASVSD